MLHLVEAAFCQGLMQTARVADDGQGFILVLDYDPRTKQMCSVLS